MRSILPTIALAGLLALTACDKSATGANGPLTGTWRYQAIGLKAPNPSGGTPQRYCDLEWTLDLTQDDNEINGETRARQTPYLCSAGPGDTLVVHDVNPARVWGEVQDGHVFVGFGMLSNVGEVHPDRIEGVVTLRWAGETDEIQVDTLGTFVMERVQ